MSFYKRMFEPDVPDVDRNAPKPRGIRAFGQTFVREWRSLIKVNLLFVLYCLPVVTVGAAMGALAAMTMQMARDLPFCSARDFHEEFRTQFKRYSLASLPAILLFFVIAAALFTYWRFSLQNVWFAGGFALAFLAAAVCAMAWQYVLPQCAVTDLSIGAVWKNAFLLCMAEWKHAFFVVLLGVAAAVISLLLLPVSGLLLVSCGFSLLSLVGSFVAWHGIKKHVRLPETDEQP